MSNLSLSATELDDQLAAMLKQEESRYKCQNYLSPEYEIRQTSRSTFTSKAFYPPVCSDLSSSGSSASGGLNEIWREKICEWTYQVVDHFDFNREIVAISLSYLDRFLATRQVNKKIFQLAAMTTLYLSVKLFEPQHLRMSSLIELSRGYFTVEHIAVMEATILRSLSWHVHPPTTLAFTRLIMQLLPIECCRSLRHDVMELSRFLSELSVCDYFFVTRKASSVAVATLLNAIDGMDHFRLSTKQRQEFVNNICLTACIDCYSDEVVQCRARLRDMYQQGGYSNQDRLDNSAERMPSPVEVKNFPSGGKLK